MDRKALIREYKETQHPMGVYRVRNTATGQCTIDTSLNLPAMQNRIQAQLRFGAHKDQALQDAWNRIGPEAFEFEILDTISPPDQPDYDPAEDLKTLKEMWIEKAAQGEI